VVHHDDEGKPVYEVWPDPTYDPDTLERRRENILKPTAGAMIQLSAPKLGELEFEHATATTTEDSNLDETSEDVMFSDLGPFDHTQDYLRSLSLDSLRQVNPPFTRGQQKLLQIMIDPVLVVENERLAPARSD
jgi:hypothetical protein